MKKIYQFIGMLVAACLLSWSYPFWEGTANTYAQVIDALEITKSDGLEQVMAGDGATHAYTIQVTNTGDVRARNVEVTDTWPVGLSRGSITPSRGFCTILPTGFICYLGSIDNGDQETITVNYSVPAGTQAGDYTNEVEVTDDEYGGIVTASDVTTVVTEADVRLVSKLDSPDPVNSGAILTYNLTVTNFGPSNASMVLLTDDLPAGTEYNDSLSTAACRSETPGIVTCPLGTVGPGSSRQVEIKVLVTLSTAGTLHNTADVTTATTDPNTNNNMKDQDTTVIVDVTKPVVTWVEPVLVNEYFPVDCRPVCEPIHFAVDATDNFAVQRVNFFRWDHFILDYVDIGDDFTAPYTWEFDPDVLPFGYNQIYAQAYDIAAQPSDRKRIFLTKEIEIFMPVARK